MDHLLILGCIEFFFPYNNLSQIQKTLLEELDCLDREDAWICLAALRKETADKIVSGHAQSTTALLNLWLNHDMDRGFDIKLVGGKVKRMRLNPQAFFISDADAQRCTFHLRGASGIRPCFRCKNIVAKGFGEVDPHGFFKEISCPQYSQLLISSDAETFQSIDHLSTIRTAKQLENLEKSCGINFRPFSFWNDRVQRNRLPPSHVLGDPMHIFWANGCMSAEINLFLAAFQTTVGDINILITSLNGIPFQTGGHKAHSAHVKRMLNAKLFQGPFYKGSARQCSSVMWLLWYAIQKLLIGRGILVKEIQSFSAAIDICRTLDRFTYSTEVVQNDIELYLHQVDRHQALFNVAYPDDCRPKHHARYHVVDALRLLGKYLHCEPHASCMIS